MFKDNDNWLIKLFYKELQLLDLHNYSNNDNYKGQIIRGATLTHTIKMISLTSSPVCIKWAYSWIMQL